MANQITIDHAKHLRATALRDIHTAINLRQIQTSAAAQFDSQVLTKIYAHITHDILNAPLAPLPIQAVNGVRQPSLDNVGNQRFSPGEIREFKKALIKSTIFGISKVCKGWFGALAEMH